jgi:hypothetical protein
LPLRCSTFDKLLQAAQARLPKHSVSAKPGIDRFQRAGVQFVDAEAPLPTLSHQARTPQQPQVFRDGGTRNREGSRYLTGRPASVAEEIQDGAAGRIGQRAKGCLLRIRNHTVTHNA